jgi:hypothetical protein
MPYLSLVDLRLHDRDSRDSGGDLENFIVSDSVDVNDESMKYPSAPGEEELEDAEEKAGDKEAEEKEEEERYIFSST